MTNQATGASRNDIGKIAIVNGFAGKGTVIGVCGRTVTVEMPYGIVAADQDDIFVVLKDAAK